MEASRDSSEYQGAFPIDGKGEVDAVAQTYDEVTVVYVDGAAVVYGPDFEVGSFQDDIGVDFVSYDEAIQADAPGGTESTSERVQEAFSSVIISPEERLEVDTGERVMTDGYGGKTGVEEHVETQYSDAEEVDNMSVIPS